MLNPPIYQNSGSDPALVKRMTQRLQQAEVDNRMLGIFQQAFEQELDRENIIGLSRPERTRLFQQVATALWTDLLGKMGDTQ